MQIAPEIKKTVDSFRYLIFQNSDFDPSVLDRKPPKGAGQRLKELNRFVAGVDNFRWSIEGNIPRRIDRFLNSTLAPTEYLRCLRKVCETTEMDDLFQETLVVMGGLDFYSSGRYRTPVAGVIEINPLKHHIAIAHYQTDVHRPILGAYAEQIISRFLLEWCLENSSKSITAFEICDSKEAFKTSLYKSQSIFDAIKIEPYLLQTKIGQAILSSASLNTDSRYRLLSQLFREKKRTKERSTSDKVRRILLLLKIFEPEFCIKAGIKALHADLIELGVIPEKKSAQFTRKLAKSTIGKI